MSKINKAYSFWVRFLFCNQIFKSNKQLQIIVNLYEVIEEYDGEKITLVNGEEKRTFDKKQISKINAEIETQIESDEEQEEKEDE